MRKTIYPIIRQGINQKTPISATTQNNYNIRIKYLEIIDYTNID